MTDTRKREREGEREREREREREAVHCDSLLTSPCFSQADKQALGHTPSQPTNRGAVGVAVVLHCKQVGILRRPTCVRVRARTR